MEAKFKYCVSYKCKNQEEVNEILEELEKLGYTTSSIYPKYMSTRYIAHTKMNGGEDYAFYSFVFDSSYLCDTKELFLALASMRDSDEFFEGEYVQFLSDKAKGTSYFTKCWNRDYILRIDRLTIKTLDFDGVQLLPYYKSNSSCGNIKQYFKKLSKEEIINYFNSQKKEVKEEKQMDKKIIGYKLVKTEYEEAVKSITGAKGFNFKLFEAQAEQFTLSIQELKNAGVLDLWFEPVYEEELEVDKWYKYTNSTNDTAYVRINTDLKTGTGISILGNWADSISLGNKIDWILMTKSEIKEILIAEAKRRGFKQNTKFKGVSFNKTLSLKFSGLFYGATGDVLTDGFGDSIYKQGKWAEILPSYPDITVNNYKAEFFDDYISFNNGCAKFDKDIFVKLLELNSFMNKSNTTNRTVTSIKLGAGEFTFAQIKQIAEYYKNK